MNHAISERRHATIYLNEALSISRIIIFSQFFARKLNFGSKFQVEYRSDADFDHFTN